MNTNKVVVSLLLCLLPLSTIKSMDLLSSSVELPSVLLELGAICTDKQVTSQDFIRLMRYIKFDNVLHAMAIESDTLSMYFNREECGKLIELCSKVGQNSSKAETLLHAINIEAWGQILGCQNLKKVLKLLTKLYFFEGTQDERIELLNKLTQAVAVLEGEGLEILKKYIKLEKVQETIDKAFAKNRLSWDNIPLGIATESLSVSPYIHGGNSIALVCQLLKRETPSLFSVVNCVRWDTLLLNLHTLLKYDERLITGLFDAEKLQIQLKRFQNNQSLDPQSLREMINKDALEQLGIPLDSLDEYLNFNLLAKGLSKVRMGLPAPELKKVCNLERIEEKTGLDVRSIFRHDVPEEVQQSRLLLLTQQVTSQQLKEHLLRCIYYSGALLLLWTAGYGICPSCMDVLAPRHPYVAATLFGIILYLVIKQSQTLEKQPSLKTFAMNITMIKFWKAANRKLGTTPTTHESILACIPKDAPFYDGIAHFVSLLTEEHLKALPDPNCVLALFENPRNFITKQEDFIDAICRYDRERTPQRIACIKGLLEAQAPYQDLSHARNFGDFKNFLLMPVRNPSSRIILRELPHEQLLTIAQYRPHLLHRYPGFLKSAQEITYPKFTRTPRGYEMSKKSILNLFYEAVSLAQSKETEELKS